MKTNPIPTRIRSLCYQTLAAVLLAVAGVPSTRAASFNPPDLMTYQGYLADGSGAPLAPSAPVNYNVVFRIYDAQSGGALLWAEVQTVTVDKGQFSVVLGEGAQNASEPRPALGSVFASASASDRFLDMTVTIGGNPLNIAPRLRYLPSPYAFTARQANSLVSPDGAPLVTTANGQLTINGTIANGGAIANSATTATSASLANSIVARDAGNNFAANQIFLTGTLHALNASVQTIRAHWNAGVHEQGAHLEWNHRGAGETWLLNHKGLGTGGIVFGEVDSARGITERMRIDAAGRLGIGTATPTAALVVESNEGTHSSHGVAYFRATHINGGAWGSHINYGSLGDWYIRSSHPSGKVILQDTPGNVGIGTAAPANKLGVLGNADISGSLGVGVVNPTQRLHVNGIGQFSGGTQIGGVGIANGFYGDGVNLALRTFPGGGHYFQTASGVRTDMYIAPHGYIGIGTFDVGSAVLTVASGPGASGLVGSYINVHGVGGTTVHGTHPVSIRANGTIWSEHTVIATSDARIKNVKGRSDRAQDLKTLLAIEITDYRYKDTIGKGADVHKKVIAQQVEKVFPQAVSQQTGVIPDIFKKAAIADGWVMLAVDLKPGERVRIMVDKDGKDIHEVLEVEDDRFRVDAELEDGDVFVYGREVKDFRAVDYDAIAMLNVSAAQAMAAKVEALEKKAARIDELEREVSELKKLVTRIAGLNSAEKSAANSEVAAK